MRYYNVTFGGPTTYIRIFVKGCEQAMDKSSLIHFTELESLQRCPDLKNLLVGVLVAHHA